MNFFETVWQQRAKFFAVFFVVFTITYVFLVAIDFIPEPVEEEEPVETERLIVTNEADDTTDDNETADLAVLVESDEQTLTEEASEPVSLTNRATDRVSTSVEGSLSMEGVLPVEIRIPKLNRTAVVLNPSSRAVADLDAALLNGVVRHPDSATLNQQGNVFILGHSSYLPNVFNRNFQAFNGLQDLAWGDTIEVSSEGMVFEYRVDKVYKANATDTTVPIAGEGHRLILATCNSFGSVDDRFIVEAKRVDVRQI